MIYNDSWYSGHTIPGYSLLYPPLGAWLGPELLGAICAVARGGAVRVDRGAGLWEPRLARRRLVRASARPSPCTGAGPRSGSGSPSGSLRPRHATSPARPRRGGRRGGGARESVAGLFTALAAAAVLLAARLQPVAAPSRLALVRAAWAVGLAAITASLALALAFPTPGFQPFTTGSFLWVPVVCAVCFVVLPVGETTLRCGIVLYALLAVVAFEVATPFGGNAIRLGTLFAGPVMALALYGRRPVVLLLLAAPLLWWQWSATDSRRLRGGGRSGDRGGLLRAARQRARAGLRGEADQGGDPADEEPLGVGVRRRALPPGPRLAPAAGVRRLPSVHRRQPDSARLREVAAGARRRLRGGARHLARLPR